MASSPQLPPWISGIISAITPTTTPEAGKPIELPWRIEWGEFSTTEAREYRVDFSKPFGSIPAVICSGYARAGEVKTPPPYTPPRITEPTYVSPVSLPIPAISKVTEKNTALLTSPTITVPDFSGVKSSYDSWWSGRNLSGLKSTLSSALTSLRGLTSGLDSIKSYIASADSALSSIRTKLDEFRRTFSDRVNYFLAGKIPLITWYGNYATDATLGEYRSWGGKYKKLAWFWFDEVTGHTWVSDDIADGFEKGYTQMEVLWKQLSEPISKLKDSLDQWVKEIDDFHTKLSGQIKSFIDNAKSQISNLTKPDGTGSLDIVSRFTDWLQGDIGSVIANQSTEISKLRDTLNSIKTKWEELRNTIDGVIGDFKNELSRASYSFGTDAKRFSDEYYGRIHAIWDDASRAIGDAISKAYESVTTAINGLYDMVGVRKGVFITPVAIKSVTREYFTIEGTKDGEYEWMAIGLK
jgi:gas vesicle protein